MEDKFPTTKLRRSMIYSQNLLRDPGLARHLINKVGINNSDMVYEIGGGTGVITSQLADICKNVVVFELDNNLYQKLKIKFAVPTNVKIISADFVNFPIKEKPYKIFSNIPFNRTADIIRKIVNSQNPPTHAYLFLQEEAAKKFIGSPKESLFSILIKPFFAVEIIYKFRKSDFSPAPGVNVVLLSLVSKGFSAIDQANFENFRDFIIFTFNSRKPGLKETFRMIFSEIQFKRLARDLKFTQNAIPTDLNIDQWLGIFRFFIEGTDISKKLIIKDAYHRYYNQQKNLNKIHRTRKAKSWELL